MKRRKDEKTKRPKAAVCILSVRVSEWWMNRTITRHKTTNSNKGRRNSCHEQVPNGGADAELDASRRKPQAERMYATTLPPRPNPHARVAENYAPQFSREELPLLPTNWIPSWRTAPSKIWADVGTGNGRASSYPCARPKTTGWGCLIEVPTL